MLFVDGINIENTLRMTNYLTGVLYERTIPILSLFFSQLFAAPLGSFV
jgi:hypothetical protein